MPWFKGNLHCHSNWSDGRATPERVAKFYRFIGYDFLGISDHNRYTPVEHWAPEAGILGIPSCEYTGEACCHVVSVGVKSDVKPAKDFGNKPRAKTIILQDGIDKTLAAGGIPVLCHPAWHWAFTHNEMFKLKNCRHFELCNGSPDCNAFPIPGYEPLDNLWDELLSSGHRYFGMANDDAHEYFTPWTTRSPHAAVAYNMVKTKALTEKNIINAIRKGHFYASTGVVVDKYRISREGIRISITPLGEEKASFQFFGAEGKELYRVAGTTVATYKFKGNELYVRIRIASTAGVWAWMQPVFMDELNENIAWTASK
jgi:hypothetical protein